MRAILLVGGRGTRLQPLTNTRPKPMLPIVDLPFLHHQLDHLRRHGVDEVTFACGFLPSAIVSAFGEGDAVGMRLNYVIEPEPLDTGGAIAFAARTLERQRLVVCNGDILTDLDVGALVAWHEERRAVATIALTPVDDPSRYGLVRTTGDGAVTGFLEKPDPSEIDTDLINAGTYVLEPAALDLVPQGARCNVEREVFPQLVGRGLHALASRGGYWLDIGTFPSYLAANVDMLEGHIRGADVDGDGRAASRTRMHATATVSADATLHDPVHVGPGATIEGGAVVGPGAVIAASAVVRSGARVAHSVVLERACIEREAQVLGAIVGEDARVGRRCTVRDGAVVAPGAVEERAVVRGAG